MTVAELRDKLDALANDNNGDVAIIARGVKFYADGCPDEEVAAQVQQVLVAFAGVVESFKTELRV